MFRLVFNQNFVPITPTLTTDGTPFVTWTFQGKGDFISTNMKAITGGQPCLQLEEFSKNAEKESGTTCTTSKLSFLNDNTTYRLVTSWKDGNDKSYPYRLSVENLKTQKIRTGESVYVTDPSLFHNYWQFSDVRPGESLLRLQ